MLKEAIDRILSLVTPEPKTLEINGQTYTTNSTFKLVPKAADPLPTELTVGTLDGFVDLVNAGIEKFEPLAVLVVIESYKGISLRGRFSNIEGKRPYLISCELNAPEFKFGEFLSQEKFLIALKSYFTIDGDREVLVALAGNLTHEKVVQAKDDGFTQQASLRKGVVLAGKPEDLKSVVQLAPFRTFREINQPTSGFIFRVKQLADGQIPECALFEADGGKWKLDAVAGIKEYLSKKITNIPIIA